MGVVKLPKKVMLFSSIMYQPEYYPAIRELLIQHFGAILEEGQEMRFSYTNYYEPEMGSGLARRFIAFEKLVERDSLPEIKLKTNAMEEQFMKDGKRQVNLDPGILSLENVNLATTKPYSHRIYLKDGIWAEVTLMYQHDTYNPLPWTYPDYASPELIGIFNNLRNLYKGRLACRAA